MAIFRKRPYYFSIYASVGAEFDELVSWEGLMG